MAEVVAAGGMSAALMICCTAFAGIGGYLLVSKHWGSDSDKEKYESVPNRTRRGRSSSSSGERDSPAPPAEHPVQPQQSPQSQTKTSRKPKTKEQYVINPATRDKVPTITPHQPDQAPGKPSLFRDNPDAPKDEPVWRKPGAKGRRVSFSGGDDGTAATSVVMYPKDGDSRLWDASDDLIGAKNPEMGDAPPLQGRPTKIHKILLDGSGSPLKRYDQHLLPSWIIDYMVKIERMCHTDWLQPGYDKEHLASIVWKEAHPIYGLVPGIIDLFIRKIIDNAPDLIVEEKVCRFLFEVGAKSSRYRPARVYEKIKELNSSSHLPLQAVLLGIFIIPQQGYPGYEWINPQQMSSLSERIGLPAAFIVEWLNYIATPFLTSQLFTGIPVPLATDNLRVSIMAHGALKGYVMDVTIFGPHPDGRGGWEEREWQMSNCLEKALKRCLILARNWIEYRYMDSNGKDRYGAVSGGDPIVHRRLFIRPGHILPLDNTEASEGQGKISAPSQPGYKPQFMTVSNDSLVRLWTEHRPITKGFSVVENWYRFINLLHPTRVAIINSRQNAWHSDVKQNLQFDQATFTFMYMLLSLGLTMDNGLPDDLEDNYKQIDPIRRQGYIPSFTELDLGGIIPMFVPDNATEQLLLTPDDLPSIQTVVLPYVPTRSGLGIIKHASSSARLLIEDRFGFKPYMLTNMDIPDAFVQQTDIGIPDGQRAKPVQAKRAKIEVILVVDFDQFDFHQVAKDLKTTLDEIYPEWDNDKRMAFACLGHHVKLASRKDKDTTDCIHPNDLTYRATSLNLIFPAWKGKGEGLDAQLGG